MGIDMGINRQADVRIDGRTPDALRPVKIVPGYIRYPEGSVLVQMGHTHVICNATVDDRVPSWLAGRGRGWVTAEYALLPRSTHTRTPRETRGLGGRTQEIRRLIGRSLRAAVNLDALGERQIIVDCDVIQADGGTRTASVTGGYVALALAVRKLVEAGVVSPQTLQTPVAAVSVGVVDGVPVLDLCYKEDRDADVDFNVVMTGQGEFIELQGTAEGQPFDRQMMDQMLDLAEQGIRQLFEIQRIVVDRVPAVVDLHPLPQAEPATGETTKGGLAHDFLPRCSADGLDDVLRRQALELQNTSFAPCRHRLVGCCNYGCLKWVYQQLS